jgi:site-specific DNA-methyltransferase (adenine-specific)
MDARHPASALRERTQGVIEPYYEDESVVFYHSPCEDLMEEGIITQGSLSIVLTDPPYGINFTSAHRKRRTHIARPIVGDDHLPVEIIEDLAPLLRDTGALYWFCTEDGITPFAEAAVAAGLIKRRVLVWDKLNWASGDLEGDWASRLEYICWAAKGRHLLRGGRPHNLLQYHREASGSQDFKHPSQKPLDLLYKIIETSTDPGDLIFDPYSGSGSTLRAAKDLGRKAIGCEVEEIYCEVVAKRLGQGVLF